MIFCFSQDSHTQHNDSDAFQFYGRFKTSVKTCQQVDNSLACCEMYILRPPNWGLIRPMNLYLALSCVFFFKNNYCSAQILSPILLHGSAAYIFPTGLSLTSSGHHYSSGNRIIFNRGSNVPIDLVMRWQF